ncbi:MAG: amidohydrolase family protein [Mariniphaga sp.]|nr:amidohydrolase family protein [Mariniphaga sp.]MDD4424465.1 amidohydrolase family protein [Mariniphaga sp.]
MIRHHFIHLFRVVLLISFLFYGYTEVNGQQIIEGIHYHTGQPVQVKVNNGIIEEITTLDKPVGKNPVYIAPGFFDNQVNGFAGVSFVFGDSDLTPEGIKKATTELWKKGVTTFLPTLTTNSVDVLTKNFEILSAAVHEKQLKGSIPGFHLEGPYINPEDGYRGAHPLAYVKLPDWEEFMKLNAASGNNIIQVTLAPEMEGALDFITKCSRQGIVVALGHHNADTKTVTAAIDRGAKIATHLGNGAANMINRHRNPFWSQLADDRLHISIICDSFHLLPEEIKVFYQVKGVEKTIITSDVTHYAAMEPGEYKTSTGETIELTKDGMLRYPAQNVLYGSASPITKGVGFVMKVTGCTLAEAVQMASTNQAKLFNLNDRGILEPGKRADIVLFTVDNFQVNIQETWVKGERVFKN